MTGGWTGADFPAAPLCPALGGGVDSIGSKGMEFLGGSSKLSSRVCSRALAAASAMMHTREPLISGLSSCAQHESGRLN